MAETYYFFWIQTEKFRLQMRKKKIQMPEASARNLVSVSKLLNAAQQPHLLVWLFSADSGELTFPDRPEDGPGNTLGSRYFSLEK